MPENNESPAVESIDKFEAWNGYVDNAVKDAEKLQKSSVVGFEAFKHTIEEMKSFLKHTHKNGVTHALAIGNACPDISIIPSEDLKTYLFRFVELVKDLKKRTKSFDLKEFNPRDIV